MSKSMTNSSSGEAPVEPTKKTHILTVSVEDYFHVGAFRDALTRKHWNRLESRLEHNIARSLELLESHKVRATFFISGWVAERSPGLVQDILEKGHEIGSAGYWPNGIRSKSPQEFKEDLRRAKAVLEWAGAADVIGYRSPRNWLTERDTWILDVLAEEGYVYDSSINPVLRHFAGQPDKFEVHRHQPKDGGPGIWEFPISTDSFLGLRYAISGGNYIRQLPHSFLKIAVERWSKHKSSPLVFYFMPWELDKLQPQIQVASRMNRIRHYRNLEKTLWVLELYMKKYNFQPIREYLGLPRPEPKPRIAHLAPIDDPGISDAVPNDLPPVTLVIPVYNEEASIAYLYKTLREFRSKLESRYRVHFCIIDDGSRDDTWNRLKLKFDGLRDCRLIQHGTNQGVAAAILTGIKAAETETVCSIDCDCSYDPNVLEAMIPLLENADMVTASPYHPNGKVVNVPNWRLFLSHNLCRMYSILLEERFYTYTSCCRVYRRKAMIDIPLKNTGFLGVAEMLVRLKLLNGKIVEYPATLESRILGESKMKIVKTINLHLGFLKELFFNKERMREESKPVRAPELSKEAVP
jgi:polysaccharide deacetylase family protein (PEP-CTERM system associated)